jgi:hypothetical protein
VGGGYAAIIRRLNEALGVHADDNQQYYHAASTDSDIDDALLRDVAYDTASDTDELTALEVDMLFNIMENGNDTAGTDDDSNDEIDQMFASAVRGQRTAIEFNHNQHYAAQHVKDQHTAIAFNHNQQYAVQHVRDQNTAIEFNHTQQYAAQREHDCAACYPRQVAVKLGQAVQPIDESTQLQPQQHVQHQQQQYTQPVQPNWHEPVMQHQQQFVRLAVTDSVVQSSSTHIHIDMSNCVISGY